jgi:hypothetical protein
MHANAKTTDTRSVAEKERKNPYRRICVLAILGGLQTALQGDVGNASSGGA